MIRFSNRLQALPGYPLAEIPSIKRRLIESGMDVIDLGAGDVAQVNDVARAHHGVGQPGGFLRGHAAPEDRHEQSGRLVVGEGLAVAHAAREELDLVLGQGAAVAFLEANDDARLYLPWIVAGELAAGRS